jgi:hypothetical protein
VEVTALVVLFCAPPAMPVTLTTKLHVALAASVAPDRLTLADPAVAVIVPPPQLPESALGVDTTKPEGIVSVKATPDKELLVFGFARLKVSVVVPFSATLAAPNDLAIVGGKTLGGGGVPEEPPPPQAATPLMQRVASIAQLRRRCDRIATEPPPSDESPCKTKRRLCTATIEEIDVGILSL